MARRPRAVTWTALLLGALGLVLLAAGTFDRPALVVMGVIALVLVPGLWIGTSWAGWAGVGAGIAALFPGIYGAWGVAFVARQWDECLRMGSAVSSLATSYPAGFCTATDWFTHWGTGLALVAVGIAGIATLNAVVRHSWWFRRGGRGLSPAGAAGPQA
jgi:hypothetical protein